MRCGRFTSSVCNRMRWLASRWRLGDLGNRRRCARKPQSAFRLRLGPVPADLGETRCGLGGQTSSLAGFTSSPVSQYQRRKPSLCLCTCCWGRRPGREIEEGRVGVFPDVDFVLFLTSPPAQYSVPSTLYRILRTRLEHSRRPAVHLKSKIARVRDLPKSKVWTTRCPRRRLTTIQEPRFHKNESVAAISPFALPGRERTMNKGARVTSSVNVKARARKTACPGKPGPGSLGTQCRNRGICSLGLHPRERTRISCEVADLVVPDVALVKEIPPCDASAGNDLVPGLCGRRAAAPVLNDLFLFFYLVPRDGNVWE
ncbi:hypothetical protein B0J18DRAFT_131293 [Chaetomium sp. MPI-SDFR-AT-0129]|nr:hypothetical protein B0J18DRAFT_131293 [Chaetomium sp. MPI-SDFR-AT-0129]